MRNVSSERLDAKRMAASGVDTQKQLSNSVLEFMNKYAVCKCPPVMDCLKTIENDKQNVICGSDGVEYANKCQLERRQCLLQRRIWVSNHDFSMLIRNFS